MHHEAQRRDLCTNIERWRSWSAFNEEATIQSIVLPILELAGYDTRDPEEVLPQARDIQGNKPDLMLYKTSPLSNGVEWCVIEAKALGKPLNNYVAQVGQYLIASNAQWYVLTDGFEWRFFDKNHPQNNFYRAAITLEMPGALDALCCLLDKARPTPDFDCAFQTLIEARLREAARQVEWEKHCTAWELTGQLVIPLQKAVAELSSQFDQAKYIQRWIEEFQKRLASQAPPSWWDTEAVSAARTPVATPPRTVPPDAVSFAQLKQQDFPVTGTAPKLLIIGGQEIPVRYWAIVIVEIIKYMDSHQCLPAERFVPFWKSPFYTDNAQEFTKYDTIESVMFSKKIFVNQLSNTKTKLQSVCALLENSRCHEINPETVFVVYAPVP